MEYKEETLEKIGIEIIDGDRGKNYPNGDDFNKDEYCLFLNAKNVTCNGFEFNEKMFISKEKDEILRKGKLKRNDIVLTTRGTVGNVGFYSDNIKYDNMRINSGMVILRNKDLEHINNKYIYWYFKYSKIQNEIMRIKTGSAQPQLPISILKDLKVCLPNKEIQNKIVKILDGIEKKIILNNEIKDNLYEMGKTYYRYFFKKYEFTDNFKNTELGKIPVNYEIKTLSEVTRNNRDKVGKNKGYRVLSAVKTGKLQLSEEFFNKHVPSKKLNKYVIVQKDDFAYNPARINIGSIGRNEYDFNACVSPVYISFSIDDKYKYFWDFYFKDIDFNNEVSTRASGSVRQTLKYEDFGLIKIAYPNEEIIDQFNYLYNQIDTNIKQINKENETLEQLRDTLLPKLIKGEINLDKIEI